MKIKLKTVNDAAIFVKKCGDYSCDIDYKVCKYLVDAKSIMGILSTDLSREAEVTIHTEDDFVLEKFKKDMQLWKVRKHETKAKE